MYVKSYILRETVRHGTYNTFTTYLSMKGADSYGLALLIWF
jgi:hypothetical protein